VVVFGARFEAGPLDYLALVPALFGSLALFLSVGIALAGATMIVKRTGALTAFVGEVLAIFGGVYFPLSVLPRPLEVVGQVLPFTWAVDVTRGILVAGDIRAVKLIALFVAGIVSLPVSGWFFARASRRARRDGSLVEY
jgi:ABC-2 type transport system permease protein